MKKLLLLAASLVFSVGAWANNSCKNKPHAPMPSKNLSLYDEKTGALQDYSVIRQKLLKDGWIPVPSDDKYADHPEEECIVDRCIFKYKDKYKNTLTIEKPDDISTVRIQCQ